ncbi:MFS general substrate transporter [Coniophora puteana RWD-64-598 SS2]|uniref:MFS general substrate transporter n=1 Tax=Coniophora puteana (strain RWD-64-598) TaxID=741705 RepID=A0A5M3N207_CONPW|nr:MFS general substrate transporter [Coniophora puteana RWD-64-598 SS2]EIW85420.1 MFS general substrate transporter [Coniophora puteana RWD-64-598 SS2]
MALAPVARPESASTLDESRPLLAGSDGGVVTVNENENGDAPVAVHGCLEAHKAKPRVTPIPVGQLLALCIVRLADPIVFTQLFPYVNEFMSDLHVTDDPSRIGFYSGLVESAFAISQLCSIYQWARISDVVGRKPVIIVGILGIVCTTLVFGLSTSIVTVLVSRCLGGLFSGNIAVVHSVLGELTDSTNQATAFPIYGLMWPVGSIIGPLIGGTFSHPADKFPALFGGDLWKTHPYFLPCLISSVIAVAGAFLGYVFLEETLPSKRKPKKTEKDLLPAPADPENVKALGAAKLLHVPAIWTLSSSGFALSYLAASFDVVFVLFSYSDIETGGLAFTAAEIGYCLATSGTIAALIQVLLMPYLLRTFDCARMYSFCMNMWPIAFMLLPTLNLIARAGMETGAGFVEAGGDVVTSETRALLWVGVAVVLGLAKVGCVAFGLSMILIKDNSPNAASLGQCNGIVQFAMCFARSFAPFLVSSLFALSVDNNLLGGYLWVVVMVVVSLGGARVSRRIAMNTKRAT